MKWEWSKPTEYLRRWENECTAWLHKATQEAAGHSNSLASKTEEAKERKETKRGERVGGEKGGKKKEGKEEKKTQNNMEAWDLLSISSPIWRRDKDHTLEAPVLRERSIKQFQNLKQIIFFFGLFVPF